MRLNSIWISTKIFGRHGTGTATPSRITSIHKTTNSMQFDSGYIFSGYETISLAEADNKDGFIGKPCGKWDSKDEP